MAVRYQYRIDVERQAGHISPGFMFLAKVVDVVRHLNRTQERIDPPVGDCWGRDADEARAHASVKMEKWIAEHS